MNINKFDYQLKNESIATEPATPRDASKLLVLGRNTSKISHRIFHDLADILTANDILVFNETKVFPAKIIGKKDSGGKVEILLLKNSNDCWECLGKNVGSAKKIHFENNVFAEVLENHQKVIKLKFSISGIEFRDFLERHGEMPIPPYIDKNRPHKIDSKTHDNDKTQYNTIYAQNEGSVAAPTAGLHFTQDLLNKLKSRGVGFAKVTLHVGMGTFEPVQTEDLTKHKIHSEYFEISPDVAQYLQEQKSSGKRIIAVGTTTTRVLETVFKTDSSASLGMTSLSGDTSLFVYPPYKFKFVDAMITNFHLPKSTLLSLASAFVSSPNTQFKFTDFKNSNLGKAYSEAIKNNYRFYSFGDAMLIQ